MLSHKEKELLVVRELCLVLCVTGLIFAGIALILS